MLAEMLGKLITNYTDNSGYQFSNVELAWLAFAGLVCIVCCIGALWGVHWIFKNLRAGIAPIPSPDEIQAEYFRLKGEYLTPAQVLAYQNWLSQRRNQHLINAGAGFAALYALSRSSL